MGVRQGDEIIETPNALEILSKKEEIPSNAAVLIPLETLEAILKGLQTLNQEVTQLREKVDKLENLEEIYHGPAPQAEIIPALRETWTTRRTLLDGLPSLVKAIDEDLTSLEKEVRSKETKAPGKKSAARIEKLKKILKDNGGSAAFKQLQTDMDMNPSQFSQLVGKLDKRVFEVSLRPRGKKGEKVLKLRKRINDPLILR